jgi:hypothetical protein
MFRAKSLTINDVTDVTGFLDLHINLACRAPLRGNFMVFAPFLPFPYQMAQFIQLLRRRMTIRRRFAMARREKQ